MKLYFWKKKKKKKMLPSPYQYICKLEIVSQIINKCNQRNNILHTYAQKGLEASYRITHTVISNWIMYICSIFHSIIRNPRKLPNSSPCKEFSLAWNEGKFNQPIILGIIPSFPFLFESLSSERQTLFPRSICSAEWGEGRGRRDRMMNGRTKRDTLPSR